MLSQTDLLPDRPRHAKCTSSRLPEISSSSFGDLQGSSHDSVFFLRTVRFFGVVPYTLLSATHRVFDAKPLNLQGTEKRHILGKRVFEDHCARTFAVSKAVRLASSRIPGSDPSRRGRAWINMAKVSDAAVKGGNAAPSSSGKKESILGTTTSVAS